MPILDELKKKANGKADSANNIAEAIAQMDFSKGSVTPEEIAESVSAYLDEHLTNPTNPPVDTSLSIAGAAADAKKTGDEIGALKEGLTSVTDWELKGIDVEDGATPDTTTRAKTTNALSDIVGRVVSKTGYLFAVFAYTDKVISSASYVGMWNGSSFVKTSPVFWQNEYIIPHDTGYYFYVVARKSTGNSVSITAAEAKENILICVGKYATVDSCSTDYKSTNRFEYGGIYQSTGVLADSTARARSQLVTIDSNMLTVKLSFDVNLPAGYVFKWIVFYKDGVYAANSATGYSNGHGEYDIGAWNQFRIVFARSDNAEIPFSDLMQMELTVLGRSFTQYVFDSINNRFLNLNVPYKKDWYYGKKYAALGDSITYGYIPKNYINYPGQLKSYAWQTAIKMGMTFANYGINESTLAYSANNPMSRRFQNLPDDADLITVMGGTNDIRQGIPLGTMADREDTTFYGALHVVLGGLYKKYFIDQGVTAGKNKKIVVCTPIKLLASSSDTQGGTGTLVNMSAFLDAIKDVAEYYSFPVCDFYNKSGINPHINETIQGTVTGATGFYNPYITDGTHPTLEGAELMSNVLIGFLESLA